MRKQVSLDIQTEILLRSKRRCCLCFGLNMDFAEKKGQIAHLDKNRNNNLPSNLVFLCLEHHDNYDSSSSQSKGLLAKEVLEYQKQLVNHIEHVVVSKLLVDEANYTKVEMEEALIFHIGSHRTKSVVLLLNNSKMLLKEINAQVPPFDLEWTEIILKSVVYSGWVRSCPTEFGYYELTLNGKRMLQVLEQLPKKLKETAWNEIWDQKGQGSGRQGLNLAGESPV
ncbi:MAG: hypothetical protein GQ583_02770, partial [Methyloprofundus sp.]|nr:hypothetical protein [Methyloprofundus sp.]